MPASSACTLCGPADSWHHSLLYCSMSRCVWALSDEELAEHVMRTQNPTQWIGCSPWMIFYLICSLVEWLSLFGWFERLGERLSTRKFSESDINTLLCLFLHSWTELADKTGCSLRPAKSYDISWLPPPAEMDKMNVDGGILRDKEFGVVGSLCRDGNRLYLCASTDVFKGMVDLGSLESLHMPRRISSRCGPSSSKGACCLKL